LVASFSSNNRLDELEDSGAWFVDSGSYFHMMRMRLVFLIVSKMGSNYHAKSEACTRNALKGVGCIRF